MLRVTYALVVDLVLEGQLCYGGLFVQVPPPDGLTLQSRVALTIIAPDGTAVEGEGAVLHV